MQLEDMLTVLRENPETEDSWLQLEDWFTDPNAVRQMLREGR